METLIVLVFIGLIFWIGKSLLFSRPIECKRESLPIGTAMAVQKSPKPKDKPPLYLSYHEAGHMTLSLILGYDPNELFVGQKMDIERNQMYHGQSSYVTNSYKINAHIQTIREHICISLAGYIAERKHLTNINELHLYCQQGSEDDIRTAEKRAEKLIEYSPNINVILNPMPFVDIHNKRDKLIKDLYNETESLLDTHWELTALLAKELHQKERLSSKEIQKLYQNYQNK